MVIFLALVIVSALLTVSAVVVLFALASEAEVLPVGAEEPAASPDNCHRGAAIAPRNRAQIPLNN